MARGSEIWVCPKCGFRLDIAPLGLYAEVQCPRCFSTERVHARLGNFRLDAVLGVGGMSVVYRAFDVVLHRALALKVLNDTFRDQPERIERFENESAMMARVRHENVTSVYSAGRAYGQFYIAMELVEGVNLEYMVPAGANMPPQQALDIIRQVACGLQAASEAGLLHRDMKPGNVLITPEGRAKVIDFGLALDSREDDTEEIIWATPYYVPPETLERQPEDVRTDIYALGMTLRYLLTGIESFDTQFTSLSELVQCKRKLTPLAKLGTDTPPALADLVDHMTAFSPADRPKDYASLLEEIDEVVQELATYKGTSSLSDKRRLKRLQTITFTSAIALGAGLGILLSPSSPWQKRQLIPLNNSPSDKRSSGSSVNIPVINALEEANYDDALRELMNGTTGEKDPSLGAWYAHLARVILFACKDDPNMAIEAHTQLMRHLERKSSVVPAGERAFNMFSDIDTTRYPGTQEWASGESSWNSLTKKDLTAALERLQNSDMYPIFKVIELYVLAHKASWLGYNDMHDKCLAKIKETGSLGRYEVLKEILSKPSIHVRSSGIASERKRAEASMHEYDLTTAMERFAALAEDPRFPHDLQRTQCKVLYDVCSVGKEMLDVLKSKFPTAYRPGKSIDELVNLAKGVGQPTRDAVQVSSQQDANKALYAIDGNPDTRWCADNPRPGATFVLDLDSADPISSIKIRWENARSIPVRLTFYSNGKAYSREFTKTALNTNISVGDKPLDRIEITFLAVPNDAWSSIAELQLLAQNGRTIIPAAKVGKNDFANELRAVLLMLNGQYQEAFEQMDYIIATRGPQAPFSVMVADWKQRWTGVASQAGNSNQKLEEIVQLCKSCRLVRTLPGQTIRFRSHAPLRSGSMMFCTPATASELKRRGLAEILNDDVVPILGLKPMRYNTYNLLTGEIQPCRKSDAQHFEKSGVGKIVNSANDLLGVMDALKNDPFPTTLRREVEW